MTFLRLDSPAYPMIFFPTAVLPFNCDSDEHAGRAICQSVPGLALCLLGQERSLLRP